MKIDLKKFNKLVEDKYITCQSHPTEPLLIWNYSHSCQFDRYWTEETKMARGLITDLEGNIVARPFVKFFNLLEHTGEDSKLPALPLEEFEITEKADGSLAILFWYKDKWQIATRGSFTSDQAIKANEILNTKYKDKLGYFDPEYTYLGEIVYKINKIVIDYGDMEDIILIAAIHVQNGTEKSYSDLLTRFEDIMPIVERLNGIKDISKLQGLDEPNKEGFVIRFKSGTRVKIKYETYLRLHRLVTGVNTKTIWELLMHKEPLDELMERVPDEFLKFVKETVDKLHFEFNLIEDLAFKEYDKVKDLPTRKEQATTIKDSKFRGVIFSMLDKKPYDQVIWKMIRPVAEKPYQTDIDS